MSATSGGKICQLCGEGFQLTVVLNQHYKVAHVDNGDYDCPDCSCVFASEERLSLHQAERHGYVSGRKPEEASEQKSSKWLKCRFCPMEFLNTAMLKSHEKSKHADDVESSGTSDEEMEDYERKYPASDQNSQNHEHKVLKLDSSAQDQKFSTGGKLRTAPVHQGRLAQEQENERSRSSSGSSGFLKTKSTSRINGLDSGAAPGGEASLDDKSKKFSHQKEQTSTDIEGNKANDSNGESYSGKPSSDRQAEEENYGTAQTNTGSRSGGSVHNGDPVAAYAGGPPSVSGQKASRTELTGSNRRKSNTFGRQQMDVQRNQEPHPQSPLQSYVPSFLDALPADDDDVFTCNLCGADYATEQTLENHKRSNHVEGGQFPCNQCSCVFATRSEMIVHGVTHDDQIMTAEESETTQVSQSEDANYEVLECESCGSQFLDELDLQLHKIRNHVQDGYPCSSCSCSFMTVNDMQVHEEQFHSEAIFNNSFDGMITQVTSLPTISSTYCDKCGIDLMSESAARIHQKNSHVAGGYACQYCPTSYGSVLGLNIHVNRKHKELVRKNYSEATQHFPRPDIAPAPAPTIPCELCGDVFFNIKELTKHRKERHFTASGSHTCNQCSKNFSSQEKLNNHIMAIHLSRSRTENLGVRVLQKNSGTSVECDLCGFGFATLGSVKAHKSRSHVAFGSHCPLCPCVFQSPNGVKSHLAMFHKGAPVPQTFVTTSGTPRSPEKVSVRQDRQKPPVIVIEDGADDADTDISIFKCVECDWVLGDATDLQNHQIQFHGANRAVAITDESSGRISDVQTSVEDPLKCSICDLEFSRTSEAESHRKRNHVHGGQFPCKLCKCVFDNGGSLHAHEVTKHKSEVTSPNAAGKVSTPATCVCSLCGRVFPERSELSSHKSKAHKRTGIPCQHCTCVFGTQVEYDAHQVEAHQNQKTETKNRRGASKKKHSSRYACQYPNCDFSAKIQNSLSVHIQNAHFQRRRASEDAYECQICSKAFRTKQALVSHKSSEHEHDNSIVHIAINNPVTNAEGKFVCHFCSLLFARNKAFVNHVSTFHENDKMTCKDCDPHKMFSSLKGFNRHRSEIHDDQVTPGQDEARGGNDGMNLVITSCTSLQQAYVKPVQPRCELCNRVFFHSRSLWSHRQRSHVVGGDYSCESCNCGFQKQRSLATHTLIYHGKYIDSDLKKREQIPGECDLCGETFNYVARREIHLKKAHCPDGEYPCSDCCCRFEKRTELNLHRVKRHGLVLPEKKEDKSPQKKLPPSKKAVPLFGMQHLVSKAIGSLLSRPSSPVSFGGDDDDMGVSIPSPAGSRISSPVPSADAESSQISNEQTASSNTTIPAPASRDHACKDCTMKFSELKLLLTHQKMRHNYEERRCSICQMSFVSMMVLIDHIEAKHAKEKSTLSLSKPRGALSLTCQKCDVTFGSKTSLEMHKKKAHVQNGKFPCEICTCVFAAETELVNHMHSHNLRNKASSVLNNFKSPNVLGKTLPQDHDTSVVLGTDADADAGTKRGRGRPRKDYTAFFDNLPVVNVDLVAKKSTSKPDRPVPSNSSDQDILGMAFAAAMNDSIPLPTEIAANGLSCTICKKSKFQSLSALRKHELECKSQKHPNGNIKIRKITALRCRFCSKIFTLKISYNDHMKKKHGITVADNTKELNKIAEIDLEDDTQNGQPETSKTVPFRKPMPKSIAERKKKLKNGIVQNDSAASSSSDVAPPVVVTAPPTPPPPPPPPKTKWKCSKCKTIFKKKRTWEVHCYVSHGRDAIGSFKCDKCPATFRLKLGQYLHEKFAHKKPKKLKKKKKIITVRRNPSTKIPEIHGVNIVPSENPNETIIDFILPKAADEVEISVTGTQSTNLTGSGVVSATPVDKPLIEGPATCGVPQVSVQALRSDDQGKMMNAAVSPVDAKYVDKPIQEANFEKSPQPVVEPVSIVSSSSEFLPQAAILSSGENPNDPASALSSATKDAVQPLQGAIQDNEITSTPSVSAALVSEGPQPVPEVQNEIVIKNKSTKKRTKRKKQKRIRKRPHTPEKGFFSSSGLKKREKLVNWEETMHPCKVCAMKFRRTKNLYRHERINHPGTTEFLCIQCPSMTSLSKELDHHEEIYHSKFQNLKDVLNTMRQKRGVKRKMSGSNSPQKSKKPKKESYFDIDSLLASFTMPNNIFEERKGRNENEAEAKRRRRIKNYGIHTCRVCSMMFRSKRGLSDHLRIHAGERVFTCRTCKVQFRFYVDYMMHRKKHLALQCLADPLRNLFERPAYGTCSECQATFKTNSLAELHMEEVHPYMKFKDMCSQLCNIWQGTGENFDFNLDLLT